MTRSNRFQFLDALWASVNRIIAIAGKEFVALLKDKGSRLILVVPVIVQAVLFGYGATFNLERVPWTYYDASHSSSSMEVVRRITGTGIFELKAAPRSLGEFEETISSSTALLGLYFPPDFEKNGQVFAAADARNSTTAGVAMGYVNSIVAQINADRGSSAAFAVVERYRWNENGITRYAIIPSLTILLSMLQVLLLAGLSVAREREEGSFDMMLMTPASSLEILAGKAVPPTIIACLQALAIFLIGLFWFELPFAGSYLTLGLFVVGISLCFVGVGLAISALANNIQQSMVMVIFFLLPCVILSGLFTSIRAMPEWLQTLTLINPLRHAIVALRAIYFENAGFADLVPSLIPIVLAGVLSLAWASWLFRHKIQ